MIAPWDSRLSTLARKLEWLLGDYFTMWLDHNELGYGYARVLADSMSSKDWQEMDLLCANQPKEWMEWYATLLSEMDASIADSRLFNLIIHEPDDIALFALERFQERQEISPAPLAVQERMRALWRKQGALSPKQIEERVEELRRGNAPVP